MGKTADFHQPIWTEPWFLALPAEAKLLYIWGFTNMHSNLAGLYVVARPVIEFESALRGDRLAGALAAVGDAEKLLYDEDTGAVWVVGRVKRVRMHTVQIAKSIATAVKDCPHPPFVVAFLSKYGAHGWLKPSLDEVHRTSPNLNGNGSKSPNLRTSHEVPSQSQGQGLKEQQDEMMRAPGLVGEVMAELRKAPRLDVPDHCESAIDTAISSHRDKDAVLAAKTAAVRASDPAWRQTWAPTALLYALRAQQPGEKPAGTMGQNVADTRERTCSICKIVRVPVGMGAQCEACAEAIAS